VITAKIFIEGKTESLSWFG